jgi:hypothetical protein
MKPSIICTVAGVVFLFAGLPPRANSTCTNPNGILNATYGWQGQALQAFVNIPKPRRIGKFVPAVQIGHLTFDGNGNFSGDHDTSLGGQLIPHVDSGTYSVNSDCATGTISFASSAIGLTMSIVITSGAQEIKWVSATTGAVGSGTMRLVPAATCSASTLSGNSYDYATHGLVANAGGVRLIGRFVPFANAGLISFAADGSVSGVDNVNLGGVVIPSRSIMGTYSVNSDCTGTTTMTIDGVDNSWHFVILQHANQVIFLAIPSGIVWGGTLTKD